MRSGRGVAPAETSRGPGKVVPSPWSSPPAPLPARPVVRRGRGPPCHPEVRRIWAGGGAETPKTSSGASKRLRMVPKCFRSLRNDFGSVRNGFRGSEKTLGASGTVFGASETTLGASGTVFGAPERLWERPERFSGVRKDFGNVRNGFRGSGKTLGASETVLARTRRALQGPTLSGGTPCSLPYLSMGPRRDGTPGASPLGEGGGPQGP